jgi:hypothetical protein
MSASKPRNGASSEAVAQRDFFYVGGEYIKDAAGEHILSGQVYVEKLIPATGCTQPFPIIFIHGGYQTGTVSPTPTSSRSFIQTIPEFSEQARRGQRLGIMVSRKGL